MSVPRTTLASTITSVSEDADDVLGLYKRLAEEVGLADKRFDSAAIDKFSQYAVMLYLMTDAYPAKVKEDIQVGLVKMRNNYVVQKEYAQAGFIVKMEDLNKVA